MAAPVSAGWVVKRACEEPAGHNPQVAEVQRHAAGRREELSPGEGGNREPLDGIAGAGARANAPRARARWRARP
jgi:hypothetical protein